MQLSGCGCSAAREYKQLKGAKDWLCFCAGIVLVVCGVLLLTLRNSSEQPDKGQVVPSDPRDSIEAGPPGSNPSSRPSSAAGVYPNGQPIVRKSSFTIPQDDSGRMMAVNALPFVDPRSVSTGSNPPSPGHSGPPSPSGGEKSLFDVSKGPKASPMPTIVAGETPMASMTVEEAADFKQAMRTREEEEQARHPTPPRSALPTLHRLPSASSSRATTFFKSPPRTLMPALSDQRAGSDQRLFFCAEVSRRAPGEAARRRAGAGGEGRCRG